MSSKTIIAAVIILIAVFAVAFYSGQAGGRNWGWNMMGRYGAGSMDRHFIEQMIPHHEDAIRMAEIGLQKAEHPEIKTLAGNIKRTQSEENAKMRDWYKSWFGTDVPEWSGLGMGHMMPAQGSGFHMGLTGTSDDIVSLEGADPFDKRFIEQMIPHHQMAVMMASMALSAANRQEIRDLARDIVKAQTEEIGQMREWYANWY